MKYANDLVYLSCCIAAWVTVATFCVGSVMLVVWGFVAIEQSAGGGLFDWLRLHVGYVWMAFGASLAPAIVGTAMKEGKDRAKQEEHWRQSVDRLSDEEGQGD